MNPEFRRNLWLELTPRRAIFMAGILALVFFAAGISDGVISPASAARTIYYFIVVLWGARNAGLSVVGEIRDRTWDFQRLSSISASQMTWGKLFGSTIYNWFGGAICLVVILVFGLAHSDVATVLIDIVYLVTVGLIGQATAFLASLVAVRRRQTHSRLEVFIYQIIGVLAALAAFYVWEAADPAGSLITGKKPTDFISWWGATLDARPFLLVSLALFTAWIFVACYREMRRELKLRNGPLVWLGFLAFIGIYVAGFDAWLMQDKVMAQWSVVSLRLALVATTYGCLTYVMVLLEPKDRVQYRWYGSQIASGHVVGALKALQAWIMAFFATAIVALLLIVWLAVHDPAAGGYQMLVASGLGFLTRDVAIFVLFAALGRRRSDFAAVVTLGALYVLIPAIIGGLGLHSALPLFYPQPTDPAWLGPVVAWVEGIAVMSAALTRIAIAEKQPV